MDGFVYGALCGLGFAVVEDVFYFIAVFGGDVGGVLQGFFVRVIASGLYSHVLYTGLVGMAVGIARHAARRPLPPRAARSRGAAGGRRRPRALPVELADPRVLPRASVGGRGVVPDPPRDRGEGSAAAAVRRASRSGSRTRGSADGCTTTLAGELERGRRHARRSSRSSRARRRAGAPGGRCATRAGERAADLLRRLQREQIEPRDGALARGLRRRSGAASASAPSAVRSAMRWRRSRARRPRPAGTSGSARTDR